MNECSPPLVREKLLAHELLVNLLLKLQVNDKARRLWSDRDSWRWKSDPFEHEPNARNDALCLSLRSGGDLHSLSLSHEMWQQRPTHGSRLCVPQSPFTRTLLGSVVSKSVQERRPSILIATRRLHAVVVATAERELWFSPTGNRGSAS